MKRAPFYIAVHVLVRGLVQGVGFREWTCQTAKSLKLRGFVQNLPDGSVEAVIEGPESDVDAMVHRIRTGPRQSRVDEVIVERGITSGNFLNFSIHR